MNKFTEVGGERWPLTTEEKLYEVAHAVNNLDLREIYAAYGVDFRRKIASGSLSLCPFHSDTKIGSFIVKPHSATCYSCGFHAGGNLAATKALLENKFEKSFSDEEVLLQVATDLGLIGADDFLELSGAKYKKKSSAPRRWEPQPIQKLNSEELEFRTFVYSRMQALYGLSEGDKSELLTKRNLSEARTERDYFSFDDRKRETVIKWFEDNLNEDGLEILSTVPGFFWSHERSGTHIDCLRFSGIGLLVRDANENVVAVQCRFSDDEFGRYKFFSYDFGHNEKSIATGGASAGAPVDVIYPDVVTDKTAVALVEGKFKSEILAQNGMISMSVQGVNNFSQVLATIKDIERIIDRKIDCVHVFYDADLIEKYQVASAGAKVAEFVAKHTGAQVKHAVWDPSLGKGVDDCILAGNRDNIKFVSATAYAQAVAVAQDEAFAELGFSEKHTSKLTEEDRENFKNLFAKKMKESLEI